MIKLSKVNILLVDDERMSLMLLNNIVSGLGVRCVMCNSGEEAIKKANENEFALALVDVELEDMDGYQLIKELRKMPKHKNLPFIFVSGSEPEDNGIIKSITAGAIDFIEKPPNPYVLKGKVRLFINMHMQRLKQNELINELEFANNKIRENENRFRSIANYMNDGLLILDNKGKVTFMNLAAENIFKRPAAAILGNLPVKLFYASPQYKHYRTELIKFINGRANELEGNTHAMEVTNAEGARVNLEITSSIVRGINNRELLVIIKNPIQPGVF